MMIYVTRWIAVLLTLPVCGQVVGGGTATGIRLVNASRIPIDAKKYLNALGDRVVRPGQERSVMSGRLEVGTGQIENVSWVWEFPGKLRLTRNGRAPLIFHPSTAVAGSLDDLEDELLEVLSADTAENFLEVVQQGVSPRLLGQNFRVLGATGFGLAVDVFELAAPVRARRQAGYSVKHYMFDSGTGLLRRVIYRKVVGTRSATVLTEFSDYERTGGHLVARKILRKENGQQRFRLDVESAQWQAGAADGLFGGR